MSYLRFGLTKLRHYDLRVSRLRPLSIPIKALKFATYSGDFSVKGNSLWTRFANHLTVDSKSWHHQSCNQQVPFQCMNEKQGRETDFISSLMTMHNFMMATDRRVIVTSVNCKYSAINQAGKVKGLGFFSCGWECADLNELLHHALILLPFRSIL